MRSQPANNEFSFRRIQRPFFRKTRLKGKQKGRNVVAIEYTIFRQDFKKNKKMKDEDFFSTFTLYDPLFLLSSRSFSGFLKDENSQ